MAKSKSENSSGLNYLWSILMIICISLLTFHLILSAKSTAKDNNNIIEQTFVKR